MGTPTVGDPHLRHFGMALLSHNRKRQQQKSSKRVTKARKKEKM